MRSGKETLTTQNSKVVELELKCKKATEKEEKLQDKIKLLEGKISKHDNVVIRSGYTDCSCGFPIYFFFQIKQTEASRVLLENQMKFDQEKYLKLEKDFDKEKKERTRWESKVADIEADLLVIFYTIHIYFVSGLQTHLFTF